MLGHFKFQIVTVSFNPNWWLLAVQLSQNIIAFYPWFLSPPVRVVAFFYNSFQDMHLFLDWMTLPLSGFCGRATSLFSLSMFVQLAGFIGYHRNQWEISTKGMIATNLICSLFQSCVVIDLITSKHFSMLSFTLWLWEAVASLNPASPRISGFSLFCFLTICKLASSSESFYLSWSTLLNVANSNQVMLVTFCFSVSSL